VGVNPGYLTDKAAVTARLRRIEGQVRGLQRLVDEERYCIEILTQISATTKALQGVALLLLDGHLQHCLTDPADARDGQQRLTEATDAIRRLVRS
jgi:DNA-binding FrmR family transcriptional regulator